MRLFLRFGIALLTMVATLAVAGPAALADVQSDRPASKPNHAAAVDDPLGAITEPRTTPPSSPGSVDSGSGEVGQTGDGPGSTTQTPGRTPTPGQGDEPAGSGDQSPTGQGRAESPSRPDQPDRPQPSGKGGESGQRTEGSRSSDLEDGESSAENESGGLEPGVDEEPEIDPFSSSGIFNSAPVAVPNVVIDSFEIPPFLLPIYQACGTQYAIPWQVLAAINRIETAFGTNLSVSSAGAMGWMQFMPGTWEMYGVDANGDKRKDPYNPVDAICAAARYLQAAGGVERLREAIFAYNHANWYVDDVLELTTEYSSIPDHLISSLTGLTEGAHFPVASEASYADQVTIQEAVQQATRRGEDAGNVAHLIESAPDRNAVTVFTAPSAPVVAVNDGTVRQIGTNGELGSYLVLEDVYGNKYIYSHLGAIADSHPVIEKRRLTAEDFEIVRPESDEMPEVAATDSAKPASSDADAGAHGQGNRTRELSEQIARRSAGDSIEPVKDSQGSQTQAERPAAGDPGSAADSVQYTADPAEEPADSDTDVEPTPTTGFEHTVEAAPVNTENVRRRVYAHPHRTGNQHRSSDAAEAPGEPVAVPQAELETHPIAGSESFEHFSGGPGSSNVIAAGEDTPQAPLEVGSQVVAGTVLGQTGGADAAGSGSMQFAIRPAGDDTPRIDPKPILDGWRLLAETDIYRANENNPYFSGNGVGRVLMLSKGALMSRVLNDPRIEIYSCGRDDVISGQIDRRVLATLAYLAERGFHPTVTSLLCGRSGIYTSSGNVSNHVSGRAVDIAALNGQPILGNQGPGSLTEGAVKAILRLQGTAAPDEVISLHDMGGPSFAMGDHHDHIHVGFSTSLHDSGDGDEGSPEVLEPDQWSRLIRQLGRIDNPDVRVKPSKASKPGRTESAGADETSGP